MQVPNIKYGIIARIDEEFKYFKYVFFDPINLSFKAYKDNESEARILKFYEYNKEWFSIDLISRVVKYTGVYVFDFNHKLQFIGGLYNLNVDIREDCLVVSNLRFGVVFLKFDKYGKTWAINKEDLKEDVK